MINRLTSVGVLLSGLVLFGTCGFVALEGWSWLDGFFMTVITLSTVGYGTPQNLSEHGQWFTSVLIVLCIVSMTYWTAILTSFIVENDLGGNFLRRRFLKMISQLKDHTIVCGIDQMAETVIETLIRQRKSVVVVSEDADRLQLLRRRFRKLLTVEGSPTDERVLAQANVLEAKYVVAAMDSEIDNLLISITCKDLGGDIEVFARSNDLTIANRMRKARVDAVISPNQICGSRVAEMILG